MGIIIWGDDLSVNIQKIDSQHQQLVALINGLYETLGTGKSKDSLGHVLDSLVDYTKTHFVDEERLLSKHGFPGLAQHKAEHDQFTGTISEIQTQFQEGNTALSMQVMVFLSDWLTTHIRISDKAFSPFLVEKGVR
jgi:hemerythrin